jgi:hypothetical protein
MCICLFLNYSFYAAAKKLTLWDDQDLRRKWLKRSPSSPLIELRSLLASLYQWTVVVTHSHLVDDNVGAALSTAAAAAQTALIVTAILLLQAGYISHIHLPN